ncbi:MULTISPECIES: 3-oxoacyl-ACP synthase [Winogradskyella]|uniref:3-oxoacyl-ACP synthase n=1 Tax=Winogradskyella TaxID=286104 RepID=UPI0015CE8FBF|nr:MULTISPECIES: 3-oxoacyl-ACP synthase [Winogradskyella]QXP80101.1 3-oxoacyl-ACP synthase [Winogradskyella sp. HaHa_3_26]
MKKNLNTIAYCRIKDHSISVNGKEVITKDSQLTFPEFAKLVYKEKDIAYPKFFKMDNLSKLGFLVSEFLFENAELNQTTKENIGIVLSNKSASLDTDRKYQETINDKDNYFPSPAVFVYTLANIMIGEISIRHQIKGENVFFVSDKFNETLLDQYASSLIKNEKSSHVLCGWVDVDNDKYDAFMYLVAEEESENYSKEIIKKIYKEN